MKRENFTLTESEVVANLAQGRDLFWPLKIDSVEPAPEARNRPFDARVVVSWRDRVLAFEAEVKTRTAPRIVSDAVMRLRVVAGNRIDRAMIIVPYLSPAIVEILEREQVNALDLNGNYFIQTRELVAVRLDRANRYPESQTIKNIFSGNSSLVGRLFLSCRKTFPSVNAVWAALREKDGKLSLSAVSKVLAGLERDLIVERGEAGITLLQPDKLLRGLEEGYKPPKVVASMRCRMPALNQPMPATLINMIPNARWMVSGQDSSRRYEISASSGPLTIYVDGPQSAGQADMLRVYEDERFPNLIVKWLDSSFPFFDDRSFEGVRWASPVQCCLELSKMGKREQEAAAGIRAEILKGAA